MTEIWWWSAFFVSPSAAESKTERCYASCGDRHSFKPPLLKKWRLWLECANRRQQAIALQSGRTKALPYGYKSFACGTRL